MRLQLPHGRGGLGPAVRHAGAAAAVLEPAQPRVLPLQLVDEAGLFRVLGLGPEQGRDLPAVLVQQEEEEQGNNDTGCFICEMACVLDLARHKTCLMRKKKKSPHKQTHLSIRQ